MKILVVNAGSSSLKFQLFDVENNYVLPGFIDPHIHFRDPGLTQKEDFKTGSEAAANGGFTGLCTILLFATAIYAVTKIPKVIQLMNAKKRLFAFGNGIRKALLSLHLMEGGASKVVVESEGTAQQVYLSGGTGRDKALFTKCVNEFFGEIDNQRYLLVRSTKIRGRYDFYAVPEVFAKRKEDVETFYNAIKPYMGKYDLVYTRSENGRKILLEARMKSIANQKNHTKARKKVKSF